MHSYPWIANNKLILHRNNSESCKCIIINSDSPDSQFILLGRSPKWLGPWQCSAQHKGKGEKNKVKKERDRHFNPLYLEYLLHKIRWLCHAVLCPLLGPSKPWASERSWGLSFLSFHENLPLILPVTMFSSPLPSIDLLKGYNISRFPFTFLFHKSSYS